MPAPASAWRWPLLALASWSLCWLVWRLLGPGWQAGVAALLLGLALAGLHRELWRRLMVMAGFPLALLASGSSLPAWTWLLALGLLLLAYPWRGWRDAPLFPTPRAALTGLPGCVPLAPGARVLDAGCGLGDGLLALRRAYPQAQLAGIEYSRVLQLLARLRCPWAQIRHGDMWAQGWQDLALLYVFQRPESMTRVLEKARAELPTGAWLASLDFELPGQRPHAQLATGTRHVLWVYRAQDLHRSAQA